MTNIQVIDEFTRVLIESPDHTMEALCLRLSATKYEMVLKRVDPLKHFYDEKTLFEMETGQRCSHQEQVEMAFERR